MAHLGWMPDAKRSQEDGQYAWYGGLLGLRTQGQRGESLNM